MFFFIILFSYAVKYEARLEDGTVVSKSDGVEFIVRDGWFSTWFDRLSLLSIDDLYSSLTLE